MIRTMSLQHLQWVRDALLILAALAVVVGLVIDAQDPCRGYNVDLIECEFVMLEEGVTSDQITTTFEEIAEELGQP